MSRKLSDWLRSYMEYSQYSEAPDKFHFWTGVSCIAGALRRRVWLDMGYFQWTPNFYIIFVAPPGIVSKSTTLSIGMNLLRSIDTIHFGPDVVTWQAMLESLAKSTEEVPINKRFHAMSCITIASSEFGTFLNPNDREMVDVLVSLWDGQLGTFEKHTKTQGSDTIINPWINIAACTTPAWIAGNFPQYLVGGGFTSRCVWVYAEKKRRLVAYPGKEVNKDFHARRAALAHDLEKISTLAGQFEIAPEATEWGEQWYEDHYVNPNKELNNSRFAGYLARKQTHIHKLAMVLSAAEKDELVITRKNLEAANAIITSLEADMPKVFSHIGLQGLPKAATELLMTIKAAAPITSTELFARVFQFMSWDDYQKALEALAKAKKITVMQRGKELMIYGHRFEKVSDSDAGAS